MWTLLNVFEVVFAFFVDLYRVYTILFPLLPVETMKTSAVSSCKALIVVF